MVRHDVIQKYLSLVSSKGWCCVGNPICLKIPTLHKAVVADVGQGWPSSLCVCVEGEGGHNEAGGREDSHSPILSDDRRAFLPSIYVHT